MSILTVEQIKFLEQESFKKRNLLSIKTIKPKPKTKTK